MRSRLIVLQLMFASTASASVVEHRVTPQNVATTDGVEVRAGTRANGDVVFTLRVDTAPEAVYPLQVRLRPGAREQTIAWIDAAANPLVARIVVRAADVSTTEISVMRDFGLVGHRYVVRARDWSGV